MCAAQKINISPTDCVVVEDAKAGIVAANRANMTSLALFGDARNCGEEDYNLSSFSDLLNIL